jgi:integrase
MGVAKAAVNFAWHNRELDRPVPFFRLPEGEPRDRVLSRSELVRLWSTEMPAHIRVFLTLLIGTAARPEAALQLTRFQCDLERGFINLNPPGRERNKKRRPILPLANILRPRVEAADDGPLVCWRGKPVGRVSKTWRSVRKAAGLNKAVVPYAIRHTIATEMRQRGVPELELAGFLGHAMPNFRTTGRYAHVAPDHLSHARAAIDEIAAEIGRASPVPMFPVPERVSSVLVEPKGPPMLPLTSCFC